MVATNKISSHAYAYQESGDATVAGDMTVFAQDSAGIYANTKLTATTSNSFC